EHDQHVRPLVASALLKELLSEHSEWKEGEKEKFIAMQEKIQSQIDSKYSEETEVIFEKEESDDKKVKSFSIKIKSNDDTIADHISNVKKANKHISLLY